MDKLIQNLNVKLKEREDKIRFDGVENARQIKELKDKKREIVEKNKKDMEDIDISHQDAIAKLNADINKLNHDGERVKKRAYELEEKAALDLQETGRLKQLIESQDLTIKEKNDLIHAQRINIETKERTNQTSVELQR